MIFEISFCLDGVSFESIYSKIFTFHLQIAHSRTIHNAHQHINHTTCPIIGNIVPSAVAHIVAPPAPLYFSNIPLSFIAL